MEVKLGNVTPCRVYLWAEDNSRREDIPVAHQCWASLRQRFLMRNHCRQRILRAVLLVLAVCAQSEPVVHRVSGALTMQPKTRLRVYCETCRSRNFVLFSQNGCSIMPHTNYISYFYVYSREETKIVSEHWNSAEAKYAVHVTRQRVSLIASHLLSTFSPFSHLSVPNLLSRIFLGRNALIVGGYFRHHIPIHVALCPSYNVVAPSLLTRTRLRTLGPCTGTTF